MKKTIFTTLFAAGLALASIAGEADVKSKVISLAHFSELVINSDIKVVLTNEPSSHTIRVEGDQTFLDNMVIRQKGKQVLLRNRLKGVAPTSGTVYIPAASLGFISVNCAAELRSGSVLQSEKLYVEMNGVCKLHIATSGQIYLIETEQFKLDVVVSGNASQYKLIRAGTGKLY